VVTSTSLSWVNPQVSFVMAAFPTGNSPRLKAVSFGVEYDANAIGIWPWGNCGDGEVVTDGWPLPGTGARVTWNTARTDSLVEVYWFAAYTYTEGATGTLFLTAHPEDGAAFWSDVNPTHPDSIACLGSMGFNIPGTTCCHHAGASRRRHRLPFGSDE
jgi:hypothetical protein